jgi:hypothetical protein
MGRNPLTQPARRCSLLKRTSSLGSTRSSLLPSNCWACASSFARCTLRRPSRSSACASTSGRCGSVSYSRGTGPCGCDVSEAAAATAHVDEAEVAAVLGRGSDSSGRVRQWHAGRTVRWRETTTHAGRCVAVATVIRHLGCAVADAT